MCKHVEDAEIIVQDAALSKKLSPEFHGPSETTDTYNGGYG